jgi:thiamine-monophosphate kinase
MGSPPPSRVGPLGPEFELIEKLAASLPSTAELPPELARSLDMGIGDDAAVWDLSTGGKGIFTIDTVVEGVHAFGHEPPEAVGARGLTAAVSDIAAMGGRPLLALIALQAPRSVDIQHLARIYDGMGREAVELGVAVAGGDVVDTPGPMAISVAVFGIAERGIVWTRSGAQPGNVLAVTGNLGGSRAGVELLELGDSAPPDEWAKRLMERHMTPRARVKTALAMAEMGGVSAAIDISDGLSSEAWHLALDSGVGINLNGGSIPLHPDLHTT